jgi:hypothetical protein
MSASMPRTASTAPDMRQVLVAVIGLILAVGLLVAVTISRQVTAGGSSSQAVPASVAHDHGWSAAAGSRDLVVGGLRYTGIPYPTGDRGLVVQSASGGLRYTGIPYPAPRADRQGGSNGTRFAR